jgi:hypothetical protein
MGQQESLHECIGKEVKKLKCEATFLAPVERKIEPSGISFLNKGCMGSEKNLN